MGRRMTTPIVKVLYTKTGYPIDTIIECGNCGAFICYETEQDIDKEYKFCHRCGSGIKWGNADNWTPLDIQPEHKTYVEGLMDENGEGWTSRLWHEVINGKSIYYDKEGFQVNPILWRPL